MHQVPVVHGMTIAEYGQMINEEGWLDNGKKCKLILIPIENYTHDMRYSLPIAPSPNLQTEEAVYLYPSLCLFEGTDISLGRGTDTPFQVYGHPQLTVGNYYFIPEPRKGVSENTPQKGKKCRGFNLTDEATKKLNTTNSFNISYIINAYKHFPEQNRFFTNTVFFDKLAGNSTLRWQIIAGKSEEEIRQSWQKKLEKFKTIRKKYLLYKDFE